MSNEPLFQTISTSTLNQVWPVRPAPPLPDYDARSHALMQLRNFFAALEFQRTGEFNRATNKWSTIPFRLPKSSIQVFQPDDIVKAVMPGIGIISTVGVHESLGLGPSEPQDDTLDVYAPGTALRWKSDYVETFTIEAWGSKQAERRALMAGLCSALQSNDQSYSLQLKLPRYYDQIASFELVESQYLDGQELDVTNNRRRALIMVTLTVPEVELVNVVQQQPVDLLVNVVETVLEFQECCPVDSCQTCSC